MDDESLEGSYKKPKLHSTLETIIVMPKATLQDRLITYAIEHPKTTRDDLFINISSSGTAGKIITGLVRSRIFVQRYFDCNTCTYFEVDQTKINIA